MPSPNKALAVIGATIAATGIGIAGHNTLTSHGHEPQAAALEIKDNAPAVSIDAQLGRAATHGMVTGPAQASETAPASPSVNESDQVPAPASEPATAPHQQAPASAVKPQETSTVVTKDGEDRANAPSTKPARFKPGTSGKDSLDGYEDDDSLYGDDKDGGDWGDDDTGGKGPAKPHPAGEMGDDDGEPSGTNPQDTIPDDSEDPYPDVSTPPLPQPESPLEQLGGQFTNIFFNQSPDLKHPFVKGVGHLPDRNVNSIGVKNVPYKFFGEAGSGVLFVGYRPVKGGGNGFAYKSYEGADEISNVTFTPGPSADGQPAEDPKIDYSVGPIDTSAESSSKPYFEGADHTQLGEVAFEDSSQAKQFHFVLRDGQLSIEPVPTSETK